MFGSRRLAVAGAALTSLALAGPALAHGGTAPAPAASAKVRPLFLSQQGCGESAGAGRLELRPREDTATGCGTPAGLPLNEVTARRDLYSTTKGFSSVVLDSSRKITGQVVAESDADVGGVGTVEWDVALTARTASGGTLDLGSTTVSAEAEPGHPVASALFSFTVPKGAAAQRVVSVSLSVVQRGLNVGMNAKHLNGESWLALPLTPTKR
jgi:hypothetical protein